MFEDDQMAQVKADKDSKSSMALPSGEVQEDNDSLK